MKIQQTNANAIGTKFYLERQGQEVARAYLYILGNGLHNRPFGLLEDVHVNEALRGQGIGSELVRRVIVEAGVKGCYKLICTSRYANHEVHKLYERLGFKDHGLEFRLDIPRLDF